MNRAILLTAPGAAAIAVVRITGPGVRAFLARRFSRAVAPLRCVHGDVRDAGGEVLDDALVVLAEDGRWADLNLHGGPWVVESVLALLERNGFAVVRPDEADPAPADAFDAAPADAFDAAPGDAVDARATLEREVLCHLPLARTEAAIRVLLAQPAAWQRFVASGPGARAIAAVLADASLRHLLRPPRVAIVGPPNVGKSTLANQLFGQQRSITADLPGTTRDWVGEIANLDGLPVMLMDTPGLRATDDAIERTAIERSREVIESAELIVEVRDPSTAGHPRAFARGLLVLNKADLSPSAPPAEGAAAIATVATTGQGVGALRRAIRAWFGCDDLAPDRPRWWTRRQRDVLLRASIDFQALAEL